MTNAPETHADALREKYRLERERRLRPDGEAQFFAADTPAEFLGDPHAAPGFTRPPVEDRVEVAVIGGGLGGLLAGARLREAGVQSLRIVEKAADFGGAWYWNRYPGIACDVDATIYMPLLEELGAMPSEKYARGAEIFAHCQAIGRHYRLYDNALLQTEVTAITWQERDSDWDIETSRQDHLDASGLSAQDVDVLLDAVAAVATPVDRKGGRIGEDQSHDIVRGIRPKPASQPDLSCLPDYVGRRR